MTEHSPERPGPDGLGYGKCTGCGEIWPCSSSRPAAAAELHAWLVARWTEHRATAEVATPGPWTAATTSDGQSFIGSDNRDPAGTRVFCEVVSHDGDWKVDLARQAADAAHIAANDPALIIAVCDAALRRLARHAPVSRVCHACTSAEYVSWPCPEVLDDAAPWAERSDFPDELRRV